MKYQCENTDPNLFPYDICYSIVDDDAFHARLWHDFLHNCSEGIFGTSLSILFGNCGKKIAEKNDKHDRYQTCSRLPSNKILVLYEIPYRWEQKEKKIKLLNLFMRLLTR